MTASLSMRAAWQQVAAEAEAMIADRDKSPDDRMSRAEIWEAADRIRVTALAQINALNEAHDTSDGYLLIPDPETT